MATEVHHYFEVQKDATFVVFGASGDLAQKKTFPALYNLFKRNLLPVNCQIVGYARSNLTQNGFRDRCTAHIEANTEKEKKLVEKFFSFLHYVQGQYDQDDSIENLNEQLGIIEGKRERSFRFFYLAVPPSTFVSIARMLKKHCVPKIGFARILIEKPFGRDLQSARDLRGSISKRWKEEEVLRIDHYLGKEVVRNLFFLRTFNSIFSMTWNSKFVERIEIFSKEKDGTEGRGGYFDQNGIFRDIFQNHMMQILSLLTMETPSKNKSFEALRAAKAEVLRAIPEIKIEDVVIGQYGKSLDNTKPAYIDDKQVPRDSRCATYGRIKLFIKNERWYGVPIILAGGKALDENKFEVRIHYKDQVSFANSGNILKIEVQPNPSIHIKLNSKKPGFGTEWAEMELKASYEETYPGETIPGPYEALFYAAFRGDYSNFSRDDEIDEAWRIFTPFLQELDKNNNIKPIIYPYGSSGPTCGSN